MCGLQFFLLLLLPIQIVAQISCPKPIYVGNPIGSPAIPTQTGHGAGKANVVYSSTFTIPCECGVLAYWHLIKYDNAVDGCLKYRCDLDLIVFRNISLTSTLSASVVGSYHVTINNITNAPAQPYIVIAMPQSEWIPVKYGDAFGWNGPVSSVVYYEESCGGVCPSGLSSTNEYLFGPSVSSVNVGQTVTFSNGPAYSYPYYRYYGLRAIVYEGTRPSLDNLPQTISITDSTPVNTEVFPVMASDPETKQKLSFSIRSSCPQPGYFTIDPIKGAVKVNRSLVGSQSLQTLTIEVSDQCLTYAADLTINIITVSDSKDKDESEVTDLFKSSTGWALLASTIMSCLVAIGTSIGLCYFCSQLSSLNSRLNQMKGIKGKVGMSSGDGKFLYNGTKEYSLNNTHYPPRYEENPNKRNDSPTRKDFY